MHISCRAGLYPASRFVTGCCSAGWKPSRGFQSRPTERHKIVAVYGDFGEYKELVGSEWFVCSPDPADHGCYPGVEVASLLLQLAEFFGSFFFRDDFQS